MKKGDILKLSKEGLDFIYGDNLGGRERAKEWRFEFRCVKKDDPDCFTVKKLPEGYYQTYYQSFLELV